MKKIISYIIISLSALLLFAACDNDNPSSESILDDNMLGAVTEFDIWLEKNIRAPYNIRYAYRLDDIETDYSFNVVPAKVEKSKDMAILLKHLWLEAYVEVIGGTEGITFIRTMAPKLFHIIGSAEHNPTNGTVRLGAAEGGMKITITEVNYLNPKEVADQEYFATIHHEFAHILHQTKVYPPEFNEISVGNYSPTTWHQRDLEEMNQLGFITLYAGSAAAEDFVELIARYVTWPKQKWNDMLETAGSEGRPIIEEKFKMVKTYMLTEWNVDLDKLHTVVQRRVSEIRSMDLEELY